MAPKRCEKLHWLSLKKLTSTLDLRTPNELLGGSGRQNRMFSNPKREEIGISEEMENWQSRVAQKDLLAQATLPTEI